MLPVSVAAELAWAVFLWRYYGGFLPCVPIGAVVAGAVAIVAMVLARLTGRGRTRLATAGLTAGVVAARPRRPRGQRPCWIPATPAARSTPAPGPPAVWRRREHPRPWRGCGRGILGATITLSASERWLYDYLTAHRDGASYLMAVSSWSEASPYILSTLQ